MTASYLCRLDLHFTGAEARFRISLELLLKTLIIPTLNNHTETFLYRQFEPMRTTWNIKLRKNGLKLLKMPSLLVGLRKTTQLVRRIIILWQSIWKIHPMAM